MPNICSNVLLVKGKEAEVLAFKEKYKTDEISKWLDLDKVVSKDEFIAEQQKVWDKLDEKEKEHWNRFQGFEGFWFNNGGYEWNVEHFGTKWNPETYEPQLSKDDDGLSVLSYYFGSAWSPIDKSTHYLIKQNPHLAFELFYEETGEQFAGEVKGENGEVLVDDTWNIEQEECPECECTGIRKEGEKEFVCEDCGHSFEEVNEDDN